MKNNRIKRPKYLRLLLKVLIVLVILLAANMVVIKYFPTTRTNSEAGLSSSNNLKNIRDKELLDIKNAIKAHGAKWQATANPIFMLSDQARKQRVGAGSQSSKGPAKKTFQTNGISVPATLDWRNNNGNYVTSVKNQGDCGSCWAFATTAEDESYNLIQQNIPGVDLDLSEEILLSCSGAGTCLGGYNDQASAFIMNTGLPLESCDPYNIINGHNNGVCSDACQNWQASTYKVGSTVSIPATVDAIEQALNQYGPISISMNVYSDFYSYGGGIYSYTSGYSVGGHFVLLVGYDNVNQYFIAKNSWGTSWGEGGYFRIAFSQMANLVGFASIASRNIAYAPNSDSVIITSPTGGAWNDYTSTTMNISWTFTGNSSDLVKIELYKGGYLLQTINPSIAVSKLSYAWTMPTGEITGNDYQIKISGLSTGESSISNHFVIYSCACSGSGACSCPMIPAPLPN